MMLYSADLDKNALSLNFKTHFYFAIGLNLGNENFATLKSLIV